MLQSLDGILDNKKSIHACLNKTQFMQESKGCDSDPHVLLFNWACIVKIWFQFYSSGIIASRLVETSVDNNEKKTGESTKLITVASDEWRGDT
jgi:hypothetical protein